MLAESVGQLQTGEKTLLTCVPRIGLFSSFSPSANANAAAVPASRPTTSSNVAIRPKALRF